MLILAISTCFWPETGKVLGYFFCSSGSFPHSFQSVSLLLECLLQRISIFAWNQPNFRIWFPSSGPSLPLPPLNALSCQRFRMSLLWLLLMDHSEFALSLFFFSTVSFVQFCQQKLLTIHLWKCSPLAQANVNDRVFVNMFVTPKKHIKG